MDHERHEQKTRADAARVFTHDGEQWTAYEIHRPYDRRASLVLVFESGYALRVVRDFPHDWRSLSDEELWALSWRR